MAVICIGLMLVCLQAVGAFVKTGIQCVAPACGCQEIKEGRRSIHKLANQWYQDVRVLAPSESDDEQVEFDLNGSLLQQDASDDEARTSTL